MKAAKMRRATMRTVAFALCWVAGLLETAMATAAPSAAETVADAATCEVVVETVKRTRTQTRTYHPPGSTAAACEKAAKVYRQTLTNPKDTAKARFRAGGTDRRSDP